ncbi:MAG: glutaminyl-peptide cyclotransferase [Anaerolineae bacterium]|nr:glutaminyl-peptide cyclotransferase [Anaerolineae bacterium]
MAAAPTLTAQAVHLPLIWRPAAPTLYTYRVLKVYPHDRSAFTQGLIYEDGLLYEGTGLWGGSELRLVELETGQVLRSHALAAAFFGEGIALWDQRILQLTWRSQTGLIYNRDTFAQLDTFSYPGEGWGLTHDGERLIMSDGTSWLRFWDPETLAELGRVEVRDRGEPVVRLNELEYIEGRVYANVWQTDRIAVIDPESGRVAAWIDLTGLLPEADRQPAVDVLNGIAYDAKGRRLFVTGKWWPKLFEIELVAMQSE